MQVFLSSIVTKDFSEVSDRIVFVIRQLPPVRTELRKLGASVFLKTICQLLKLSVNYQQAVKLEFSVLRDCITRILRFWIPHKILIVIYF
jgi:hypothetical protein